MPLRLVDGFHFVWASILIGISERGFTFYAHAHWYGPYKGLREVEQAATVIL